MNIFSVNLTDTGLQLVLSPEAQAFLTQALAGHSEHDVDWGIPALENETLGEYARRIMPDWPTSPEGERLPLDMKSVAGNWVPADYVPPTE